MNLLRENVGCIRPVQPKYNLESRKSKGCILLYWVVPGKYNPKNGVFIKEFIYYIYIYIVVCIRVPLRIFSQNHPLGGVVLFRYNLS